MPIWLILIKETNLYFWQSIFFSKQKGLSNVTSSPLEVTIGIIKHALFVRQYVYTLLDNLCLFFIYFLLWKFIFFTQRVWTLEMTETLGRKNEWGKENIWKLASTVCLEPCRASPPENNRTLFGFFISFEHEAKFIWRWYTHYYYFLLASFIFFFSKLENRLPCPYMASTSSSPSCYFLDLSTRRQPILARSCSQQQCVDSDSTYNADFWSSSTGFHRFARFWLVLLGISWQVAHLYSLFQVCFRLDFFFFCLSSFASSRLVSARRSGGRRGSGLGRLLPIASDFTHIFFFN